MWCDNDKQGGHASTSRAAKERHEGTVRRQSQEAVKELCHPSEWARLHIAFVQTEDEAFRSTFGWADMRSVRSNGRKYVRFGQDVLLGCVNY